MSDSDELNNKDTPKSPEPETGWSYNPDSEQSFSETPSIQQDHVQPVSWTASEYIAHDKSVGWYIIVSFLVFAFAFAIYFFDDSNGIFSPILVIIAGIIFMVAASRKPSVLEYTVDDTGLHIGQKLYSYAQFKSFSLVQEGIITTIVFTPLQRFMPSITIYFEPKDQESIVNSLSVYLPYETKKIDAIDNLMRKIRF